MFSKDINIYFCYIDEHLDACNTFKTLDTLLQLLTYQKCVNLSKIILSGTALIKKELVLFFILSLLSTFPLPISQIQTVNVARVCSLKAFLVTLNLLHRQSLQILCNV